VVGRCSCPAVRLTQRRIALSERTKLRSVRSSRRALAATLLFIVGIGVIACAVIVADWPHSSLHDRANFQALTATLAGVNLAQLSVGALGVLAITAEYSTGMI
jgi:ABC-2 type transport system permease protein